MFSNKPRPVWAEAATRHQVTPCACQSYATITALGKKLLLAEQGLGQGRRFEALGREIPGAVNITSCPCGQEDVPCIINKPNKNSQGAGGGRAKEALPNRTDSSRHSWTRQDLGAWSWSLPSSTPVQAQPDMKSSAPTQLTCILPVTNQSHSRQESPSGWGKRPETEVQVSARSQGELLPISGPQFPQPWRQPSPSQSTHQLSPLPLP